MGQKRPAHREQPTIGDIPDDVWPRIQMILDEPYPATPKGHRRVDLRRVLHGIISRRRTGCQWNPLPARSGDDRTVHRHLQPWCQRGTLGRIWAVVVEPGEALGGGDGPWQAADAAMGQARRGGDWVGRNPTERGNKG